MKTKLKKLLLIALTLVLYFAAIACASEPEPEVETIELEPDIEDVVVEPEPEPHTESDLTEFIELATSLNYDIMSLATSIHGRGHTNATATRTEAALEGDDEPLMRRRFGNPEERDDSDLENITDTYSELLNIGGNERVTEYFADMIESLLMLRILVDNPSGTLEEFVTNKDSIYNEIRVMSEMVSILI